MNFFQKSSLKSENAAELPARLNKEKLLPVLCLLVGLFFTALVVYFVRDSRVKLDQERIQIEFVKTTEEFDKRLNRYIDALRGGASLFAASQRVDRNEWKAYIEELNLTERYPGVYGMGVVFPVAATELNNFIEQVRQDEAPSFKLTSLSETIVDEHFIITYIEPEEKNKTALGLDLASELNRSKAANTARETNTPQLTPQIKLVQDTKQRSGALLYVPFFKTNKEGIKEFKAWIYAPFIHENFINEVLAEQSENVLLAVYEGNETHSSKLLYHSQNYNFNLSSHHTSEIILAGQLWTLSFQKNYSFVSSGGYTEILIGFFGSIVSLLLYFFIRNIQNTKEHAKKLAERLTQKLKAKQTQLIEAQKMEAIGKLSAGIAHDFNNFLGAVTGYGNLLAERISEDEKAKKYLQNIMNAAQRGSQLIKEITGFVRKEEAEKSNVSVNPLILESIQLLETNLGSSIQLNTQLSDKNLQALVNPNQLMQVLMNLAVNAKDAMPSGGEIIFCTSLVNGADEKIKYAPRLKDLEEDKNYLLIEVKDNGQGIPKEIQEKIFEPLFTTKAPGKGTGLGLAMVYNILKSYGGDILVESFLGQGTSFKLYIPSLNTSGESL